VTEYPEKIPLRLVTQHIILGAVLPSYRSPLTMYHNNLPKNRGNLILQEGKKAVRYIHDKEYDKRIFGRHRNGKCIQRVFFSVQAQPSPSAYGEHDMQN
jgi:hypothetical protein